MGVQDTFLNQLQFPVDSADEHRAHDSFQSVKNQQNRLAAHTASLDNTYQDSDPRPGHVTQIRQGYESGTGNYLEERIDYSYDPFTGSPRNLNAGGRYYTSFGTIDMEKQVSWDSHGQAFFTDSRTHRDSFGITVGSESVRGFEYQGGTGEPDGLEYGQQRRGWLLP